MLAVTTLTKTPSLNKLDISGMNMFGIDEGVFKSITSKMTKIVKKHGSLHELDDRNPNTYKIPLSWLRPVRKKDVVSLFSKNQSPSKEFKKTDKFGIRCSEKEAYFVEQYLKTRVVRFAVSLLKFGIHNENGEIRLVPIVPFDRIWTDEMLKTRFEITDAEYDEICKVIPVYYD